MRLRNRGSGFTLIEIITVAVIISLLVILVVPKILNQTKKAQEAEATQSLGSIRSSELLLHNLTGKFAAAADLPAVQSALGLSMGNGLYTYKIIDASADNFLAIATPKEPFVNWLEEKAMDKDGFISTGWSAGGSGSSSGGGGYGGGSSGGGSSGGGSSGGSSGGGSSGGSSSSGGSTGDSGGAGGGSSTGDEPSDNPDYGYSDPPLTSSDIFPPTGFELTSNDGWLVIDFEPPVNGYISGYSIEKAQKIDGVLQSWDYAHDFFANGGYFGAECWEDPVVNGIETCYRATTIYIQDSQPLKSKVSDIICGTGAVNTTYAEKIGDSKTTLAGTDPYINQDNPETGYQVGFASGEEEEAFLNAGGMPILFGTSPSANGALAYFNPITQVEVLDIQYLNAPAAVISALLAHETLHALWSQDDENYEATGSFTYGVTTDRTTRSTSDSIDQEYRAFTLSGQVWHELRGGLTAEELDDWGGDMDGWMNVVLNNDGTLADESAAKLQVQAVYSGLEAY